MLIEQEGLKENKDYEKVRLKVAAWEKKRFQEMESQEMELINDRPSKWSDRSQFLSMMDEGINRVS